tara:strand:+ start:3057 stop:3323 length:267 start_codon:yes stop_codon:yes gene_type:complete
MTETRAQSSKRRALRNAAKSTIRYKHVKWYNSPNPEKDAKDKAKKKAAAKLRKSRTPKRKERKVSKVDIALYKLLGMSPPKPIKISKM